MRELHLKAAAEAWFEQASRRSAESSPFRISDPWLFYSQGDGTYTIQNALSGLFLSHTKGATEQGSTLIPLLQQAPTNDATQRWTLTPNVHGYVIRNQATGYVLDNPDFSRVQPTGIILHHANTGTNQTWIIK
jgi:hypothetical protein